MTDDAEREALLTLALISEAVSGELGIWYMSFANEQGFLGGCFVQAIGQAHAVQAAWALGINPGGEVAFMGPGPLGSVPEDKMNRLLTREEVEQM